MKLLSFLAPVLLACSPLAAPPAHAQMFEEAQKQVEALKAFGKELDQAATAPDFVGLAVAVVRNGKVAMVKTYGVRAAGDAEKVTPDTVFRLASLSKGFAGTLAAMEVKDGKLDLKTKVLAFAPTFKLRNPADTAAVTLEDVLSHRVGLPPYAYDNLLEDGVAPTDILSKYASVKPTCAVGACFTYQNTTFNIIATAIERVTGKTYEQELHARILDPLGLTATSLGRNGLTATGNWARPHKRVGMGWVPTDVKEPYYRVPAAGGLNSSINDLAKWMIAQMGGRPDVLANDILINAHAIRIETPSESARQRSLRTPVSGTWYGLGWRTYLYAGHTLITHSGGVEGYLSQIAWLPESRSGIVILSNTRGTRAGKILPAWLDYELGLPKADWFRMGEITQAAAVSTSANGD